MIPGKYYEIKVHHKDLGRAIGVTISPLTFLSPSLIRIPVYAYSNKSGGGARMRRDPVGVFDPILF